MSADLRTTDGAAGARPRWSSFWEMYRAQFGLALAGQIAYRASTMIWVFTSIIQPLVSIVVWRTVAGPGGEISGFTQERFVTYFALEMLVNHMTFVWIMWEMEWRIRTGAYSALLVRPVHPVHADVCVNITYKLVGLVGIVPATVLLVLGFRGDLSGITWTTVPAFLLALVFGMALRFMLEWTLALAAFWITKVSAINSLYFGLITFLGGGFAPLAVLPLFAQTIAWWTPFPWSVAWVIQVGMGEVHGLGLVKGYLGQMAWIVVAFLLLRFVWRRAVVKYSAVGS